MDLFEQHEPEEGALEESAYYYWYLFMREVEDYGPKHPLWKDFGDVQKPFWDWWCDHGEDIFMTGAESGVEELASDEDIQRARAEGAYLVRVDPDCTRDYLMFVFQDFLDEKGIRKKPGRRKHKDEMKFARYPFYQRPDVESLRVALDVWKLKQKKPKVSLYEIGRRLGLCPDHLLKDDNDPDNDPDKVDKLNVMNATVSRYHRWAKYLIANVGRGEFPNNKKPKQAT